MPHIMLLRQHGVFDGEGSWPKSTPNGCAQSKGGPETRGEKGHEQAVRDLRTISPIFKENDESS